MPLHRFGHPLSLKLRRTYAAFMFWRNATNPYRKGATVAYMVPVEGKTVAKVFRCEAVSESGTPAASEDTVQAQAVDQAQAWAEDQAKRTGKTYEVLSASTTETRGNQLVYVIGEAAVVEV